MTLSNDTGHQYVNVIDGWKLKFILLYLSYPSASRYLAYLFRARTDCVKRPCSGRLRRYNFVKLHYITT